MIIVLLDVCGSATKMLRLVRRAIAVRKAVTNVRTHSAGWVGPWAQYFAGTTR